MRPQHMAFLGLLLFVGTILSLLLMGSWFGASDVTAINSLSVFTDANFFGYFSIPVPNLSFVSVGLVKLVSFDYSFFGGTSAMIKWAIIYILGPATLWGILVSVLPIAWGIIKR